jgi:hypothetical protein
LSTCCKGRSVRSVISQHVDGFPTHAIFETHLNRCCEGPSHGDGAVVLHRHEDLLDWSFVRLVCAHDLGPPWPVNTARDLTREQYL